MNRDELPVSDIGDAATPEDAEVARVLDLYLAELEAGCPVDRERLLAEHPAIAAQLSACLQVMNVAERMVAPSESGSTGRWPAPCLETATASTGQSVLSTLGPGDGMLPQVQLRDVFDNSEPLIKPGSAEMPSQNGATVGRFQLQGEIARGGMGAILRGRDIDLGRELAIKVLLEGHQRDPQVIHRFIEEAQIGGQLQHPGVVPVYELGTFPDRRPFFAMKLVKGRTLASLLHERSDPAVELPRFLTIFEQVCQTMAYAHARGVIHRDLKPSNVMVGSFGEVQVMDWGLAKVLRHGGIADEAAAPPVNETVITTVRSGSAGSGSESQAGSVLGTPAYMAPEQARGDVDRIDERADVFGLGAILCEILTGQPPYAGSSRGEIRAQAARGDLADAVSRLDASVAEVELVALAKVCLAVEIERRPRNAATVAERVTSYSAGVQERLRSTELARVEAQTRADEAQTRARIERSRRRRTVALAASVLGLVVLGAGGLTYLARQRMERAAEVALALREVEILRDDARRSGDDLARWIKAREAARAVERLLAAVRDEPTRRRVSALVRDVTEAAATAETDQKLLSRLVDIRSDLSDDPDGRMTDASYEDAFRDAGFDIANLPSATVCAKIRTRPDTVRVAMAAALDHWAAVRRQFLRDDEGAVGLNQISRVVDPDPWRNRLRDSVDSSRTTERLTDLRNLAKTARMDELPAVTLQLLGGSLFDSGDRTAGTAVLRESQRLHPGDVRLNLALASCLERSARRKEAIRYYMIAQALNPTTAHDLAHLLDQEGESDQAINVFRDVQRLRPKDGRNLVCLGEALQRQGRAQEAKAVLTEAIAASRAAIELKPGHAQDHINLGRAMSFQGNLTDAIVELRKAVRIEPDNANAHYALGTVLNTHGKLNEAIAEFRDAIRLKPDDADAHQYLGAILGDGKHEYDGAIAEFRELLRLKPGDPEAYLNLGVCLERQGKLNEAIAEYRHALRVKRDHYSAHAYLGIALLEQRKFDEAIAEHKEAMRLRPEDPQAHRTLGQSLEKHGKLEEAITEYRETLRLSPGDIEAHINLGVVLKEQGKLDEAIAVYRDAIRRNPGHNAVHNNLGLALKDQGKPEEAIAENRIALRLKPDEYRTHDNLGIAFAQQEKFEEAIAEYRESIRLKPDQDQAHANLGVALERQGKLDEAIAEQREAIRLKPDTAIYHSNIGGYLVRQGKLEEAITDCREAIRLDANLKFAHLNLGTALKDQRRPDEAIVELREAIRLDADFVEAHANLGVVLQEKGNYDDAIAEHRIALRLKPDSQVAHYNLGISFTGKGRLDDAIAEYRTAIRLKPDDPEAHCNLGKLLRQQGRYAEALAEIRQGHELGSKSPNWQYPSAQWVRTAEWLVELDRKLPTILADKIKPSDAAETLGFAQVCYVKKLHAASARFWSEAFQAQPNLAENIQVQNRYNAACAAALAGCGQGEDNPKLDKATKLHWRRQAIDWLKADLAAWSKALETNPKQASLAVTRVLDHWKSDPDLAGIRDEKPLARLSEDERNNWRKLWADVDALLANAKGR